MHARTIPHLVTLIRGSDGPEVSQFIPDDIDVDADADNWSDDVCGNAHGIGECCARDDARVFGVYDVRRVEDLNGMVQMAILSRPR